MSLDFFARFSRNAAAHPKQAAVVHVSSEGRELITYEQKRYIQAYVDSFEEVLHGSGFKNPVTGYAAYIDINSFRDYFILSEVSRNVDAYKKSRFLFKDKESKGGKIHSGPPWDYDAIAEKSAFLRQVWKPQSL